jgi:hypothetical protein
MLTIPSSSIGTRFDTFQQFFPRSSRFKSVRETQSRTLLKSLPNRCKDAAIKATNETPEL